MLSKWKTTRAWGSRPSVCAAYGEINLVAAPHKGPLSEKPSSAMHEVDGVPPLTEPRRADRHCRNAAPLRRIFCTFGSKTNLRWRISATPENNQQGKWKVIPGNEALPSSRVLEEARPLHRRLRTVTLSVLRNYTCEPAITA